MKNLELELLNSLRLIGGDRFLLLAVSGGKDSVVLLNALHQISKAQDLKLAVAHYNHGLREESQDEQKFVEELCLSLGLQCFVGKAPNYDRQENMEAWAREQRYAFLEQVREKIAANFILTAHHKNDLAETVLMRILSGRASVCLGGIKKIDYNKKLFRPMLEITRTQIEEYVNQKKLSYVEDASNSNLNITRNKIRAEIIPALENKINPGLVDSLCVLAQRINCDEESIWEEANRIYSSQKISNKLVFFVEYPIYIRWRLLKLELEHQLGKNKVGYNSLARLAEAIETKDGSVKIIELGWGVSCTFARKGVLEFRSSG